MRRFVNVSMLFAAWLYCAAAGAHHVLGRPSYSLNEDSNTPPSMQIETQIGKYNVTYMVYPAFPRPNEPGRVNLYAVRMDDGTPFQGEVTFKVRDDSLFDENEEILGVQEVDDNVFRQGFEFLQKGDYIIRAEFESGGEPYQVDFPLRIGAPSSYGPIGISIAVIFIILIGVNILQRKRLISARIRSTRESYRS